MQNDASQWGIPPQPVLDAAVKFRRRLDKQRRLDLGGPPDLLVMVTGKAPLTPDGFESDAGGAQGLVYLEAQEGGDGRVAHRRARLEGIPSWSADANHVGLVSRDLFFEAYLELLDKGTTALLPQQSAGVEDSAAATPPAIVRGRLSRAAASSAPPARQAEALVVRPEERPSATPAIPALRITVINGDLTFVAEPLMLGHYRASKLTGTERVMNGLIGGAMDGALQRGLYPGKPESHQIFINTRARPENPWQLPRPRAVIVVGLGEEGSLRAADLTATVRQAVIAWAQRAAEDPGAPDFFTLATTLIGSGGTGISAAESAQLIVRGVREANERLNEDGGREDGAASGRGRRKAVPRQWPRVDALHIIELYGDRAGDAWRALQMLAASSPAAYTVTGPVVKGTGALRQPLESGYRGAEYDLITAVSQGEGNSSAIVFTIDTRRARTEVRAQQTQAPLIRSLVAAASNNLNRDPQIGRTLFQLLVPAEIETFLGGSTDTQIEVDRGTAGIPWELLDVRRAGQQRSAPVGDSHQAAAQAPHRDLPRPRRRCRRRRRGAGDRRPGSRSNEVSAAVRRTARGDGRGPRARRVGREPPLRPVGDHPARPHVAGARREDGDQCGARTRMAHRARRRPRRSRPNGSARRTAIRAASCSRTARSSGRAKSSACARSRNWCS